MKFRGSIFSFESVLAILFFTIAFSGGVVSLHSLITNYRINQAKTVCDTIDNALQLYAKNHRAVLPSSLHMSETPQHTENLKFKQGAVYPADLNELGLLESQFGYLSRSTPVIQGSKWNDFYNAEVSTWKQSYIADWKHGGWSFTYTTQRLDGNVLSYVIDVYLPDGHGSGFGWTYTRDIQ